MTSGLGPAAGVKGDETNDASIIRRSIVDPRAFDEIFKRHHRTIYWFVARVVGRDAADDVASDVFLRAFDSREGYDQSRQSCLPWLYGIASNVSRTLARSRFREAKAVRRLILFDTNVDSADRVAWRVDAEDAVSRSRLVPAINALSAAERETLCLQTFGEFSYSEIAQIMTVPIGTVRSRLSRTKQGLRDQLWSTREDGFDGEVRWTV